MVLATIIENGTREIYSDMMRNEKLYYKGKLEEDSAGRYTLLHENGKIWLDLPDCPGDNKMVYAHVFGSLHEDSPEKIINEMLLVDRLCSLARAKGYNSSSWCNDGNFVECKFEIPVKKKEDLEKVILDFSFE